MDTPQKLEFDELINLRLEGDIIWFATILLNKIKEKPSFIEDGFYVQESHFDQMAHTLAEQDNFVSSLIIFKYKHRSEEIRIYCEGRSGGEDIKIEIDDPIKEMQDSHERSQWN